MMKRIIMVMFPVNIMDPGGAEQQLLALVNGLDKSRFKPVVVSLYPGGKLEPELRKIPGAELICVNKRGKYDLLVLFKMLSVIREKRVDIIQPFLTPATFFGMIPAIIYRVPVKIVTERSGAGLLSGQGYRLYLRAEDFFSRFADRVVPNSKAGKDYLIKRGIDPDRIRVIYNGLNPERLNPDWNKVAQIRGQFGLSAGGMIVGMAASLSPFKDHTTFVKGAKLIHQAIPETKFIILGDGSTRPDIEALVKDLGMESSVFFLGYQQDVASYVASFDVFCLCSKYTEGCSNAILEAMALGKPVVATDIGGNKEIIDDGETGFLVRAHSPEALAEGVLNCLRRPDRAMDIGRRAKEMVLDRFSLSHMVGEYERMYEEALNLKNI